MRENFNVYYGTDSNGNDTMTTEWDYLVKCPMTQKWVDPDIDGTIRFGISVDGLKEFIKYCPSETEEYIQMFRTPEDEFESTEQFCLEDATHFCEWIVNNYSEYVW